ncbi:MAG TPA: biopolymer transporter ExbD [Polyangia bacterium]|nr:biopolymer transporter ExbD [Polyangia bacterium]
MAALEKVASQDDGPIASINIIPFVDIVLVLLVIFIVTSAAIVRASLKVDLPRAAAGGAKVVSTLNLALDRGGELTLDGRPTSPTAARTELQAAVARDPAAQAVIAADRTVPYGKVMEVIDLVKGAGIAGFALDVERAPGGAPGSAP